MAATTNASQTATQVTEEFTKRFEENVERAKEVNATVTESSKAGGRVLVDNYEKAAKSFFEMQRQLADTSQVEWAKNTTKTQIQFAEEIAGVWVKAARQLLK